jgi:hypothetical protein
MLSFQVFTQICGIVTASLSPPSPLPPPDAEICGSRIGILLLCQANVARYLENSLSLLPLQFRSCFAFCSLSKVSSSCVAEPFAVPCLAAMRELSRKLGTSCSSLAVDDWTVFTTFQKTHDDFSFTFDSLSTAAASSSSSARSSTPTQYLPCCSIQPQSDSIDSASTLQNYTYLESVIFSIYSAFRIQIESQLLSSQVQAKLFSDFSLRSSGIYNNFSNVVNFIR